MTSFAYPAVLKPNSWSYDLLGMSMSGGRTLAGTEQRVFNHAGHWRIVYDIPIRNREQALAWRAMVSRLRAGEEVVAKVYDYWRADGALYGGTASLAASASLRATSLSISVSGITIEPGVAFSIGDRLYRVVEVVPFVFEGGSWSDAESWSDSEDWPDEPEPPANAINMKILPPLRAAASAGTAVDFNNLRCLCVIDDPQSGDLDLDLGKFAEPTLSLVEAL